MTADARRISSRVSALILLLLVLLLPLAVCAAEPTVCIQCHEGQSGHLGEPVGLWQDSVHERNGISCHHCHGGDPTDFAMAMSPERGFVGVPTGEEIPEFCGKCHIGVQEDYQESLHGQALEAGGPQCATCHGSHRVERASLELINPQDCSRCHEYGRAETIKEALRETDRMIGRLEQDVALLQRRGIVVEGMEERLFSLRNQFHRLFHSVDVERVRNSTEEFQENLGEVRDRIGEIRASLQQRRLAGGIVVGLLLVIAVLAGLIRRTYAEEEGRS